ncbi:hypothetical protein [uncultured Mediterranean phage]|nr:hypothetical protein [uncultured Mediterranean phage]
MAMAEKKFPTGLVQKFKDFENDRSVLELEWDKATLFLEGNQWLDLQARQTDQSWRQLTGKRTDRLTANRILNVYRNFMARLGLSFPRAQVLPASPSTEDVVKAKTSLAALQYWWQRDDIDMKGEELIANLLCFGTTAIHVFYDPGKDEARSEVISPYDLYFEKGASSVEESQWVSIRTYHTKSDLKRAYPKFKKQIDEMGYTQVEDRQNTKTQPKNRVEVYECYWRDGRHALIMGDTYLYKEDQRTTSAIPIHVCKYTNVERRLWGLGLIVPLIDLQYYYNVARSQILKTFRLMAHPKWVASRASGIQKRAISDMPGEVIYHNAGSPPPQQITPAQMPQYAFEHIMRLEAEISDTAGAHSVTLGKRAVGVESGVGMQVLADKDTSQLQHTQRAIERCVKATMMSVLELMKAHYTKDKMVRMLDNMGNVTFRELKATDLVGEPEVFIQAGSAFKFGQQERDSRVLQLAQMGLMPPEVAMREISFSTGNAYVNKHVQALSHAREVLEAAKMGADEIRILPTDDLKAFKEVFDEFTQTEEFYELPEENQDRIVDILVAIATWGQPIETYEQMLQQGMVYPRTPPMAAINPNNMKDLVGGLQAPKSAQTQAQVADAMGGMGADKGTWRAATEGAENALARGAEASMGEGGL